MRKITLAGMTLAAALGATLVMEADARACGGCFAPPETPSVVTDHRMVLTIAKEQSTLYDQIRYQGSPDAFAWVLPISGTVKVGLSADVVFEALDAMTQTQIQAPPRNCPPPPVCPSDDERSSYGGASSDAGAAPGVQVTQRETVGPYDTVQLKATDPAALQKWLGDNGFAVPADVKPVIDQYVSEHFDFLALKLLPGKNVKDMRPVRVTTDGANATLPLRMVAAGTGATVGISLWVLGEGRYEPQNFGTFAIQTDELLWDWNQNRSNYTDLRAAKTAAGQGKVWEIESSDELGQDAVKQAVRYGYFNGRGGAGTAGDPDASAYDPVKDANGNVTKTASQVRDEDLDTLFKGIGGYSSRVTRLRADLAHAALATDLSLGASADQSVLRRTRQVTKEANQPQCPVYDGCRQVGSAPRDEAKAQTEANNGGDETFSCRVPSGKRSGDAPVWIAAGAGFLALSLVKASRRRRK